MFQRLFGRKQTQRRSTDQLTTFTSQIGIGTLVEGFLRGKGSYLVQGEMIGAAEVEGTVVVAAGACWKGNVTADYVQVAGKVEGNVTAYAKIDLAPTAVVTGDLICPVIAIAEGAQYEGSIRQPRKAQVTRYAERRGQGEPPLSA